MTESPKPIRVGTLAVDGASKPHDLDALVYSFDVFDTCVSRSHAHPRDLFFDLGLSIAPTDLGNSKASRFAREFQRKRIQAEKLAYRQVRPLECANIHEIYESFSGPRGTAQDASTLIAAELSLERKSIYPIASTVAYIGELRSAGHRIVFISDMYIPAETLGPLLQDLDVMRHGDGLYISCDVRLTKQSGNLYKHVLSQEGIRPEQMVHTGDNFGADVRNARRLGIPARHFEASQLTTHEAMLAGRALPRSRANSFLAALSRRTRLCMGHVSGETKPLEGLIHSTIAPFLVSYVDWVLEDAEKNGIERLYFVARDGEVLYQIATALRPVPRRIELRYLYGSRRAWLAPSILPGTSGWEKLLITPGQANSRGDILARAGITEQGRRAIGEILGLGADTWGQRLGRKESYEFLRTVLNSEGTGAILAKTAADQREIACRYLAQEGMQGQGKWALVDAGWSLNSQAALGRILESAGYTGQPRGYYIALTRDHVSESEAGPAHPFIADVGSIFSRRRVIIEHCFTPSTHATTRTYRLHGRDIEPVFGTELRHQEELTYARNLQEVAITLSGILATEPHLAGEFRRHRSQIVDNAKRLLRRPRKNEAQAMSTFGTVADLRHETAFVEPLCRSLHLSDVWTVLGTSLSTRKNFRAPSFMWLEGSSAISPIHVRTLISAMLVGDSIRAWFGNRRS